MGLLELYKRNAAWGEETAFCFRCWIYAKSVFPWEKCAEAIEAIVPQWQRVPQHLIESHNNLWHCDWNVSFLHHFIVLYRYFVSIPAWTGYLLCRVNMCLILFCSVVEGDMYRILVSNLTTWFRFMIIGSHTELRISVYLRAADFSQVKPHTGGWTGCRCVHVCSISNWPVVPVEEEPVDPLELVVPEAVAVPVFPWLIPLLPQIGRGPILRNWN